MGAKISTMAFDTQDDLDEIDWQLLHALQADGRITFRELGRRVAMSAPAVADRIRRLEERGVIRGYRAVLDLERLGFPLLAFVRVRYPSGDYRPFEEAVRDRPEILECHHITGEDCFILKVAARSMRHLEATTGRLARLGAITTSLVFSTPVPSRILTGPIDS
jgi:Lrp/AsnC family transcriptional regulator, leucine-responsive regulatory protein